MDFQDKNVLIIGSGRTGTGIAKVLKKLGANVLVNDGGEESKLEIYLKQLRELGIEYVIGHHPSYLLDNKPDFIIKNPGIPLDTPFLQECISRNIPVFTDIEFVNSINSAPVIAITGTNGKTSTTSFVGHMFKEAGRKTAVGGNIGFSLAEQVYQKDLELIVAEVSSFQLECTKRFRPKISLITNFSPDHLDRHKTYDEYINQKKKIFLNQTFEDFAILNHEDSVCKKIAKECKAQVYWFDTKNKVEQGVYVKEGNIIWCEDNIDEVICSSNILKVPGNHNLQNIASGIIIGKILGLTNNQIVEAVLSFVGVEHRLEYVDTIQGVKYYNDSKATNTDSTLKALDSFEKKVIVLLGGYDKGEDFAKLSSYVMTKAKKAIVFGATGDKIRKSLDDAKYTSYHQAKTFEEAVKLSKELSRENDIILLSPACASWDEFDNFEERGKAFKELIYK